MSMPNANLRITPPQDAADHAWLASLWRKEWGDELMVTRGRVHRLRDLEALIAWADGERVGAATYRLDTDGCELLSLNALDSGHGVGSALLKAVAEAARAGGATRVWLITSNDNLDALRFYQRRGYRFAAVYPGAITEARKIKPSIPMEGDYGIPVRDDLELELPL